MITRDNFKQIIQDLPGDIKDKILDSDKEFLFIKFNSYGYNTKTELTNDSTGRYISFINSDEYDGLSALIYLNEVKEILKRGGIKWNFVLYTTTELIHF